MNVLVQRRALRRATSALAVTALAVGVSVIGTAPASAAAGTTDRRAFGVRAEVAGVVAIPPTPLCKLQTTADPDCKKSVLSVDEPGVLTTGVLNAETNATTNPLQANSRASATDVNALAGTLQATLIESMCTADANRLTGRTTLAGATSNVPGVGPIALNPAPNTVLIDELGLRIVLNEQIVSPNGEQIIVNAVHITFTDPAGLTPKTEIIIASSQCSFHPAAAPPPAGTGFLEICKKADNSNGKVTGRFTFRFDGRQVRVPVGGCSGPIEVTAGKLRVKEMAKDGTRISACSTRPTNRLVRCVPANRLAVVRIVEGGVANETVLTITNRKRSDTSTGAIKVCKIAGNGVKVGRNFTFRVGTKSLSVPAGPANQGGFCKVAHGFTRGTKVKVTEAASSGTRVSKITVRPTDRKVSASTANRTATVRVGKNFTVVSFTNTAR